jgi:hypothetical protein
MRHAMPHTVPPDPRAAAAAAAANPPPPAAAAAAAAAAPRRADASRTFTDPPLIIAARGGGGAGPGGGGSGGLPRQERMAMAKARAQRWRDLVAPASGGAGPVRLEETRTETLLELPQLTPFESFARGYAGRFPARCVL